MPVLDVPLPDPAPTRRGRALMIQGTSSDVGKSLLIAGLARAYARRGGFGRRTGGSVCGFADHTTGYSSQR